MRNKERSAVLVALFLSALSLSGLGVVACGAPAGSTEEEATAAGTSKLQADESDAAPEASVCVQPRKPTGRCRIGWQWCGCGAPGDDEPSGWLCERCP